MLCHKIQFFKNHFFPVIAHIDINTNRLFFETLQHKFALIHFHNHERGQYRATRTAKWDIFAVYLWKARR